MPKRCENRFLSLDLSGEAWLKPLIEFAGTLSPEVADDPDEVQTAFFGEMRILWTEFGVSKHKDANVAEFSYLLVLRNDANTPIWDASRKSNPCPVGTLFELPLHITHGLPQKGVGIWAAAVVDSKNRIQLNVAAEQLRDQTHSSVGPRP